MRRQMDENENPKFSYQALMTKNGRPKVYSEEVNKAFIEWVKDEKTATRSKTMSSMIMQYRELYKN